MRIDEDPWLHVFPPPPLASAPGIDPRQRLARTAGRGRPQRVRDQTLLLLRVPPRRAVLWSGRPPAGLVARRGLCESFVPRGSTVRRSTGHREPCCTWNEERKSAVAAGGAPGAAGRGGDRTGEANRTNATPQTATQRDIAAPTLDLQLRSTPCQSGTYGYALPCS